MRRIKKHQSLRQINCLWLKKFGRQESYWNCMNKEEGKGEGEGEGEEKERGKREEASWIQC